MSKSQMSLVDAFLMSSAVKDKARNLVCKVPSYAAGAIKAQQNNNELESHVDASTAMMAVGTQEFLEMCTEFSPSHSDNVGYMFIVLDKEWYLPGQTVEGRVFFDLFIPCFQNKLMLKLEGNETFPRKHVEKVFCNVINNPEFKRSQTQLEKNRQQASYIEGLQDEDDDASELVPYIREREELNKMAKELLDKIKKRSKFSLSELNALKEVQQRMISFDRQATIVQGGSRAVAMMIEEASASGITYTERSSSVFMQLKSGSHDLDEGSVMRGSAMPQRPITMQIDKLHMGGGSVIIEEENVEEDDSSEANHLQNNNLTASDKLKQSIP